MSDIDWQGRYEDARDDLKAMQARAEQAESALAQHRAWHSENVNQIAADGERIKGLEADLAESKEERERLEPFEQRFYEMRRAVRVITGDRCEDNDHLAPLLALAEKRNALEARLAEQAPVVDRAEAICDGQERRNRALGISDGHADEHDMCGLVRAMRAARSLRGAGDAARPMASDMIDCPRCGKNHAAFIQGCAVEGRSDATGNGWDARGAGEGGNPCS